MKIKLNLCGKEIKIKKLSKEQFDILNQYKDNEIEKLLKNSKTNEKFRDALKEVIIRIDSEEIEDAHYVVRTELVPLLIERLDNKKLKYRYCGKWYKSSNNTTIKVYDVSNKENRQIIDFLSKCRFFAWGRDNNED